MDLELQRIITAIFLKSYSKVVSSLNLNSSWKGINEKTSCINVIIAQNSFCETTFLYNSPISIAHLNLVLISTPTSVGPCIKLFSYSQQSFGLECHIQFLSTANPHTKPKISNLTSTKLLLNSFSWFYTNPVFKDYRGQLFSSLWITHTTRLQDHFKEV